MSINSYDPNKKACEILKNINISYYSDYKSIVFLNTEELISMVNKSNNNQTQILVFEKELNKFQNSDEEH